MHVFVADAVHHSLTNERHLHTGSPSNTAYESMFGTVITYYCYFADDNGVRHQYIRLRVNMEQLPTRP